MLTVDDEDLVDTCARLIYGCTSKWIKLKWSEHRRPLKGRNPVHSWLPFWQLRERVPVFVMVASLSHIKHIGTCSSQRKSPWVNPSGQSSHLGMDQEPFLKVPWAMRLSRYHLQLMNTSSIFWNLPVNPNNLSHRDYYNRASVSTGGGGGRDVCVLPRYNRNRDNSRRC